MARQFDLVEELDADCVRLTGEMPTVSGYARVKDVVDHEFIREDFNIGHAAHD